MPLFYTGKGDRGKSFIGKKKIPKDSLVLQALGELDELNSFLGLARAVLQKKILSEKLQKVQENLFIIQARLAWILYPKFKAPQLDEKKILAMEKEIDMMEQSIKPERSFIVPGSILSSGWLDVLRAISRRVERRLYRVSKKHILPQEIMTYVNRLSSYLYALARYEAYQQHIHEQRPTYK